MPATCGRKGKVTIHAALMLLLLLSASVDAAPNSSKIYESHRTSQNNHPLKLTPQISVQIKVHAFLLWASFGFLMPVGVLVIRMSNNTKSAKSLRVLFYSHVILQIIAVLLANAGAILSIENFANSFENTHQRMGLALYGFIWLQSVFGFFRPNRQVKLRRIWYIVHWLLGTGISILGIANTYIGLQTYHDRTTTSVKLWTILFTLEVSIVSFLYLLQDRWDYLMKQGLVGGDHVEITSRLYSISKLDQIAIRS